MNQFYIFVFIPIQELNNVCVVDNFMLKSKKKWKAGKLHGRCLEYDKTGKLAVISLYRKGLLIKQRQKK